MKEYEDEMMKLERMHLDSQPYWAPHFKVHYQMFRLAIKYRVWQEAWGQIPRMILAIPGSITGSAPKGNIGSTRMGIFEERE